ncbi:MAG: GNAT family N-acetyltransferase [Yoonia sp.]|uniref:GNAT family N-acetyltransferase n=1 Tax=Yoonia sp. TaxID=2212373 RepID=UPI0032660876
MLDLTYHDCTPDDFDPMMALASDWDVVRQLGRWKWPADPEQVRFYCKPYEGRGFLWTIKHGAEWAGRIGITGGDIGYTLPRSVHGRGIATQAATYAINHHFATTDDHVITGSTWNDNAASQHVLEKLGFKHWQTCYMRSVARGYPVLVRQNKLTRQDWEAGPLAS